MPPRLFDIGANLTNEAFSGDLDAVLGRARDAGVARIAVTGTDADTSRAALELARRHPGFLVSTAGVHPHDAVHWRPETADALRALHAAPEVVAVGECGLDFHRDYAPRPDQEACFEAQLALAAELGKPVFVHDRDATGRLLDILRPWRDRLPRAVVHCFTGDRAALHACLDLDLHIGVTGWICDERRGRGLQELVGGIPADRLMIETDAPFLLPRTLRPRPRTRRNEPMWLGEVCARVAACRDEPVETVARTTTANACRFFGLAMPGE